MIRVAVAIAIIAIVVGVWSQYTGGDRPPTAPVGGVESELETQHHTITVVCYGTTRVYMSKTRPVILVRNSIQCGSNGPQQLVVG